MPSPGAKRRWGPTSVTRHRPRSGSLKTRPIKSVPSRVGEGRAEVGEVGRGQGSKLLIRLGEVEEGEGKVCKGEGDAFSAGGDDIDTVTAVVGEGRAKKVVSAVPVRVSRETVV